MVRRMPAAGGASRAGHSRPAGPSGTAPRSMPLALPAARPPAGLPGRGSRCSPCGTPPTSHTGRGRPVRHQSYPAQPRSAPPPSSRSAGSAAEWYPELPPPGSAEADHLELDRTARRAPGRVPGREHLRGRSTPEYRAGAVSCCAESTSSKGCHKWTYSCDPAVTSVRRHTAPVDRPTNC